MKGSADAWSGAEAPDLRRHGVVLMRRDAVTGVVGRDKLPNLRLLRLGRPLREVSTRRGMLLVLFLRLLMLLVLLRLSMLPVL